MQAMQMTMADILFVYDRVIKDPDAFLLKMIGTNFASKFHDYIDLGKFDTLTISALLPELITRTKVNPLEWLAKKPFDYEKNYDYLYHKFENMYQDSPPLAMVAAIKRFLKGYCIRNVYVWNEKDDIRQRYDLVSTFGETKLKYVTGPYRKVIDQCKPQVVYDWSAERVAKMNEYEEYNDTFFGIASYKFNFEKPFTLKYDLSTRKNVAFFTVLHATEDNLCKG